MRAGRVLLVAFLLALSFDSTFAYVRKANEVGAAAAPPPAAPILAANPTTPVVDEVESEAPKEKVESEAPKQKADPPSSKVAPGDGVRVETPSASVVAAAYSKQSSQLKSGGATDEWRISITGIRVGVVVAGFAGLVLILKERGLDRHATFFKTVGFLVVMVSAGVLVAMSAGLMKTWGVKSQIPRWEGCRSDVVDECELDSSSDKCKCVKNDHNEWVFNTNDYSISAMMDNEYGMAAGIGIVFGTGCVLAGYSAKLSSSPRDNWATVFAVLAYVALVVTVALNLSVSTDFHQYSAFVFVVTAILHIMPTSANVFMKSFGVLLGAAMIVSIILNFGIAVPIIEAIFFLFYFLLILRHHSPKENEETETPQENYGEFDESWRVAPKERRSIKERSNPHRHNPYEASTPLDTQVDLHFTEPGTDFDVSE